LLISKALPSSCALTAARQRSSDAAIAGKYALSTSALNATLKAQTKQVILMGTAVVTLDIMPESTEVELEKVQEEVTKLVKEFAGDRDTKATIEPVAFGLKMLKYIFVMDEQLGSPDVVAEKIKELEGVQSAEVSDVRRAIG
jgi:translation elongation factor aEF-1 beta